MVSSLAAADIVSDVQHSRPGVPHRPSTGRSKALRAQLYGSLTLLGTAVLWASSGPVLKYMFLLPSPPSAALVTATTSVLSAAFLLVGVLGSSMDGRRSRRDPDGDSKRSDPDRSGSGPDPDDSAGGGRRGEGADGDGEDEGEEDEEDYLGGEEEAMALLRGTMVSGGAASAAPAVAIAASRRRAVDRAAEASTGAGHLHRGRPSRHTGDVEAQGLHGSGAGPGPHHRSPPHRSDGDGGGGGSGPRRTSFDGVISPGRKPKDQAHGADHSHGHAYSQTLLDRLHHTQHHKHSSAEPPARIKASTGSAPHDEGCQDPAAPHISLSPPAPAPPWRVRLLTAPLRRLPHAGLELGFYSFAAAALGAWGMQRISATRAAFLAQATSLITPLLSAAAGMRVAPMVWLACGCGAMGGAMVALDATMHAAAAAAEPLAGIRPAAAAAAAASRRLLHVLLSAGEWQAEGGGAVAGAAAAGADLGQSAQSAAAAEQALGVNYVLLSCLFWGLLTVRLGVHTARFPALELAAAGAVSYACMALLWVLGEVLGTAGGARGDYLELSHLLSHHTTLALLLWAGLGPGALSNYLQVLGQRTVPPAQAQLLYSSTPLWAALMAQLLLPGEAMGPLAWVGGAVMLGASLLASLLT